MLPVHTSLPLSPFRLDCASLKGPREHLQEGLGSPWPRTWGGSVLSAEGWLRFYLRGDSSAGA